MNIIILPAHNSVQLFTPFLVFLNKVYKRKLHYVVIGGWLPQLLEDKPMLEKQLKLFDGIYVETTVMQNKLRNRGFTNIYLMKNFKNLNILSKNQVKKQFDEPYPVCTFARVNKEKGTEDAINAIKNINERLDRVAFKLDIFGQIEDSYEDEFEVLRNSFPEYIEYKGAVPFDNTTDVLKSYYALLFPTHYYTEGIPGTIIDAYAAGVPVIASRWENYKDSINDDITGITYTFNCFEELETVLCDCLIQPIRLIALRDRCIIKAHEFVPSEEVKVIVSNLS